MNDASAVGLYTLASVALVVVLVIVAVKVITPGPTGSKLALDANGFPIMIGR